MGIDLFVCNLCNEPCPDCNAYNCLLCGEYICDNCYDNSIKYEPIFNIEFKSEKTKNETIKKYYERAFNICNDCFHEYGPIYDKVNYYTKEINKLKQQVEEAQLKIQEYENKLNSKS